MRIDNHATCTIVQLHSRTILFHWKQNWLGYCFGCKSYKHTKLLVEIVTRNKENLDFGEIWLRNLVNHSEIHLKAFNAFLHCIQLPLVGIENLTMFTLNYMWNSDLHRIEALLKNLRITNTSDSFKNEILLHFDVNMKKGRTKSEFSEFTLSHRSPLRFMR